MARLGLGFGSIAAYGANDWQLTWSRQLPDRDPLWAWNRGHAHDTSYWLTEAGQLLLAACPADGNLRAYHRDTGAEAWRYYADAAIRRPATAGGDRVLVGSEDGTVVCLVKTWTAEPVDGALKLEYTALPGSSLPPISDHVLVERQSP